MAGDAVLADELRTELADELRTALRGEVITPDDAGYDTARRVWNGLIDRRPAVIARCTGTADVVAALALARRYEPVVSIRGGGHQVAGSAVCDDGLVIDLSAMKGVHVDPRARTARVQAGVTWGELDRETQVYGLVAPGGEVSTTGVAGFTLGGGMGYLQRAFGLACDNVRSVEIVTGDGEVHTANATMNPGLYWAVRGGGRGIGVITSFELDLHRIGPEVAVATVLYPYDDAARVMRSWRTVARQAPESISPELALWSVPADPGIPAELHGHKVVIVTAMFAGEADDPAAAAALAPLRELGDPLVDASATVSYLAVQSDLDDAFAPGGRYYMKSHFLDELSDAAIDTLLAVDADRPTPETLTVLRTLGGAISRVGLDESAFAHRSASFNLSIDATWSDPADDGTAIGWARAGWDALAPFATGGVYVNFAGLDDDADDTHDAAFSDSAVRLDELRRAYDPGGLLATAARRS